LLSDLALKRKMKKEMRNAGISADASHRSLTNVAKADMRKVVVAKKSFRTAPGRVINVSGKNVRRYTWHHRVADKYDYVSII
jgi:hypothetical protein